MSSPGRELSMALIISTAIWLAIIFGLHFLVLAPLRSQEAEAMFSLLAEVKPGGVAYVHDPENPLWEGRATRIEKRAGDIIAVALADGSATSYNLPVKIGVVRYLGAIAMAEAQLRSRIVIEGSFFEQFPDEEWIDLILAHEIAHLFSYEVGDEPHGGKWHAMCMRLYAGIMTGPPHPRACRVTLR